MDYAIVYVDVDLLSDLKDFSPRGMIHGNREKKKKKIRKVGSRCVNVITTLVIMIFLVI